MIPCKHVYEHESVWVYKSNQINTILQQISIDLSQIFQTSHTQMSKKSRFVDSLDFPLDFYPRNSTCTLSSGASKTWWQIDQRSLRTTSTTTFKCYEMLWKYVKMLWNVHIFIHLHTSTQSFFYPIFPAFAVCRIPVALLAVGTCQRFTVVVRLLLDGLMNFPPPLRSPI